MMNADLLLMLGTDFPYQQFFPKDATIVQIDVRGEQLGRRTKLDYGFVGDTRTTLRASAAEAAPEQRRRASERLRSAHYRRRARASTSLATEGSGQKPIHPQYVVRVLDELAAQDAVFTCDVGTPTIWAARYLTMNGRRRLLARSTTARWRTRCRRHRRASESSRRQVVSLSGDGGLAMLMGDLLSLRRCARR